MVLSTTMVSTVTSVQPLIEAVQQTLHSSVRVHSLRPHDPVQVLYHPEPWELLGTGNYAAVFAHPDYPDYAVKIYASGRPGIEKEIEVYGRIGEHPAYSQCFYAQDNFLILRRLRGITLYNSLQRGIPIPPQVIRDVDEALRYAKSRGLNPRDVHGKNVMMHENRGLVVDISDFLEIGTGSAWQDFKAFYTWLYRPLIFPLGLRLPSLLLNLTRRAYRLYRNLLRRQA